ncbi:acyl carrier protein [Microbacteriaceae bacterium VKM Ac-2854]|nr:acyl carrier protein [Microbacteriaceae bacterium VKM Ac-2854]
MTTLTPTADEIQSWIVEKALVYTDIDESDIGPDVSLVELGLDSAFALTLAGDIEDTYGIEVDPTFAWDYPTLRSLSEGVAGAIAEAKP